MPITLKVLNTIWYGLTLVATAKGMVINPVKNTEPIVQVSSRVATGNGGR
jgi:hypothetical protein